MKEARVFSVTSQRADGGSKDTYFLAYHAGTKPWEVRLMPEYEVAGPGSGGGGSSAAGGAEAQAVRKRKHNPRMHNRRMASVPFCRKICGLSIADSPAKRGNNFMTDF